MLGTQEVSIGCAGPSAGSLGVLSSLRPLPQAWPGGWGWRALQKEGPEETRASPSSDRPVVLLFPTRGRSGEVKIAALFHVDHSYPRLCASDCARG